MVKKIVVGLLFVMAGTSGIVCPSQETVRVSCLEIDDSCERVVGLPDSCFARVFCEDKSILTLCLEFSYCVDRYITLLKSVHIYGRGFFDANAPALLATVNRLVQQMHTYHNFLEKELCLRGGTADDAKKIVKSYCLPAIWFINVSAAFMERPVGDGKIEVLRKGIKWLSKSGDFCPCGQNSLSCEFVLSLVQKLEYWCWLYSQSSDAPREAVTFYS